MSSERWSYFGQCYIAVAERFRELYFVADTTWPCFFEMWAAFVMSSHICGLFQESENIVGSLSPPAILGIFLSAAHAACCHVTHGSRRR